MKWVRHTRRAVMLSVVECCVRCVGSVMVLVIYLIDECCKQR